MGGAVDDLRYPLGELDMSAPVAESDHPRLIGEIAATPAALRAAIQGLGPEQMATPYRPGGWTVTQVVHHLPDSHMNAYCRVKLALTENEPMIKPYDEAKWAALPDSETTPAEVSVTLLESLHNRWVTLWRSMKPADFKRGYFHPDHGRVISLQRVLWMYAWHGRHHVAHITRLRERNGW
jgi:DinB superfamily